MEQAITNDLSFAVGYIHSGGRHIPVYRSINLIPIRFLADGRPVFSRLVNPAYALRPAIQQYPDGRIRWRFGI